MTPAPVAGSGRLFSEVLTIKKRNSLKNYCRFRDVQFIGKLLKLTLCDFIEPQVELFSFCVLV